MKILVLDDREDGRYFLEMLLKGNGHEVVSAPNGAEALDALSAGGFGLIISDILMPVMDGFLFCQTVKSNAALKNIPFIFYTATYTEEQDEAFAIKIGADRFIRKPCEPAAFMAAIDEVIAAAGTTKPTGVLHDGPKEETLRLYNERLVHKLEQKMLAAERMTEELTVEKRRFQTLVDELPLGVVLVDRAGKFLYLNPRFTEMFGYALADLPTFDVLCEKAFTEPEHRECLADAWGKSRTAKGFQLPMPISAHIRCRDGSTRQVRIRFSTPSNGELIITCEDATEHIQLETKLRQSQKMEAIATLAGGIAHDFNNILAVVMGFAELAKHEIPEGSPAAKHVRGILPAAERARQLIRQILEFSRQAEQERVPVDLQAVVNEVLGMLRSTLPATIEIRSSLDCAGTIIADPTQMHQVIMNLCTNAFHAMQEKGGVLGLGLKHVTLSPEEAGLIPGLVPASYLLLTVNDTGCGMSPEVLTRIYDPYFTTKPEGRGTGLGLSVTHGIVKSHHGAIDVTSEPGIGTEFRVYFPVSGSVPEEAPEHSTENLPTGRERILLIDDEPELISFGKRMLEMLGYRVEGLTCPLDALEAFRKDPSAFDLVITDLLMPQMTGYELFEEILRIRGDIPFILSSGTMSPDTEQKARENGMHEFIMKPFSIRDMAELVRKVLDKRKG